MAPQHLIRKKLVIVGDGACGKTSLLRFFSIGEILKYCIPTVYEPYAVTEVKVDGQQAVELELHDTSRYDEYEQLRLSAYTNAHIILIAFAINTPDSLENVTDRWITEVRHYCPPHVPIILVGCKADMRRTSTENGSHSYVSREQAELVAEQIGAHTYSECSVFKNEGINELFEEAARMSTLTQEPKRNWKCCMVV